jgi:transcriptional antiterminator RfaH
MPILAKETPLFPANLLDDWVYAPVERSWWVMHTKARQEKSLARELFLHDIPFYLPLVRKTSILRGRRVQSHIPLFTGYVFVFGSDEERRRSLESNRVCQTLPVHQADQLCEDLRHVHRLIESNAPLTVEARLTPGRRVRIRSGSLAGLEGQVLRRRQETRLLVRVNFLQKGVSVEIDDYLLEPLD